MEIRNPNSTETVASIVSCFHIKMDINSGMLCRNLQANFISKLHGIQAVLQKYSQCAFEWSIN